MIERKRTLDGIKAARDAGNYDEVPVLMADVDPQLYLSRNSVAQPFHLICEKDTLFVQMSGTARLEMHGTNVKWFSLVPGDNVYVPAGTPHRVIPATESIQLRYKARHAGREAAAWYCETCGSELYVKTWESTATLSQAAYWDACDEFNAEISRRTCLACAHIHEPVDLAPFNWIALATAIREQDES
jgi:3-hydroxyanthranilate 3,4-dioxygenase